LSAAVPQHDIDALVVQFIGYRLYPRAAHTDTGADRVDALVIGFHGDLGAGSRIAGRGLDLDDLLGNLRHLDLEKLDQHFRAGAAEDELRTAGFGADLLQDGTHPVVDAEGLAADQLFARQQALGIVAQVDDDIVAGYLFHCTGNEIAHAVHILFDDLRALGVAHALHDHLLGGLRCDTAELDIFHLDLVEIPNLEIRVLLGSFLRGELGAEQREFIIGHHEPATHRQVVARIAIDRDLNIGLFVVAFLGRRRQRQLHRLEDDVLGHPLLVRHGFRYIQDLL
jgi:hypothetical protein